MSENSAPFLKTTVEHFEATAACKRSATFGHILLAAFLIVGVIAAYIEVRLQFASIRHTDSLDSSGNEFHDFIKFESALPSERDIELYERDVRMVSSHLSDALNSCTNDQLGQGQHPSSSAEDWQYAFSRIHKELRKLQRTINSLRLLEEYLKAFQHNGKFISLTSLHRSHRVQSGQLGRWVNDSQLSAVDDVFYFNSNTTKNSLTILQTGLYLIFSKITFTMAVGDPNKYVSYALKDDSNRVLASCQVKAIAAQCNYRQKELCKPRRYLRSCLIVSIEHLNQGDRLSIYDNNQQQSASDQLDVVIDDSTFWTSILLTSA